MPYTYKNIHFFEVLDDKVLVTKICFTSFNEYRSGRCISNNFTELQLQELDEIIDGILRDYTSSQDVKVNLPCTISGNLINISYVYKTCKTWCTCGILTPPKLVLDSEADSTLKLIQDEGWNSKLSLCRHVLVIGVAPASFSTHSITTNNLYSPLENEDSCSNLRTPKIELTQLSVQSGVSRRKDSLMNCKRKSIFDYSSSADSDYIPSTPLSSSSLFNRNILGTSKDIESDTNYTESINTKNVSISLKDERDSDFYGVPELTNQLSNSSTKTKPSKACSPVISRRPSYLRSTIEGLKLPSEENGGKRKYTQMSMLSYLENSRSDEILSSTPKPAIFNPSLFLQMDRPHTSVPYSGSNFSERKNSGDFASASQEIIDSEVEMKFKMINKILNQHETEPMNDTIDNDIENIKKDILKVEGKYDKIITETENECDAISFAESTRNLNNPYNFQSLPDCYVGTENNGKKKLSLYQKRLHAYQNLTDDELVDIVTPDVANLQPDSVIHEISDFQEMFDKMPHLKPRQNKNKNRNISEDVHNVSERKPPRDKNSNQLRRHTRKRNAYARIKKTVVDTMRSQSPRSESQFSSLVDTEGEANSNTADVEDQGLMKEARLSPTTLEQSVICEGETLVKGCREYLRLIRQEFRSMDSQSFIDNFFKYLPVLKKLAANKFSTKRGEIFFSRVNRKIEGSMFVSFMKPKLIKTIADLSVEHLESITGTDDVVRFTYLVLFAELNRRIMLDLPIVKQFGGLTEDEFEEVFYNITQTAF